MKCAGSALQCSEYIYLFPGVTWKSFLHDTADSIFSINFQLYASEIELVQAFFKILTEVPTKQKSGDVQSDDLDGHSLFEIFHSQKIPALHSLLFWSYDSAVLLNPTVSLSSSKK